MTLKEYIDKYSPFGFSDDELIIGFLKKRPDVLADTISTLCMMNYKSVLSLEHKVRVKDEYLNCLKDWAQGKIHKDGEFHPELRDKIENGTLVELPCKVGDVMYEVFKNHKPPCIQQTKIEKVIITNKGLRLKLERNSVYETSVSSLGKTLFDNEDEAIKKLEEIRNET